MVNEQERSLVDFDGELLKDKKYYLYSQSASWLPKTKINLFYGIWKRKIMIHKCDLFTVSEDQFYENSDGMVKFFGLAEVTLDSVNYVVNNIAGDFDNCFFASTRDFDGLYNLFSNHFLSFLKDIDFFNVPSKLESIKEVLSTNDIILYPRYTEDGNMWIDTIVG